MRAPGFFFASALSGILFLPDGPETGSKSNIILRLIGRFNRKKTGHWQVNSDSYKGLLPGFALTGMPETFSIILLLILPADEAEHNFVLYILFYIYKYLSY